MLCPYNLIVFIQICITFAFELFAGSPDYVQIYPKFCWLVPWGMECRCGQSAYLSAVVRGLRFIRSNSRFFGSTSLSHVVEKCLRVLGLDSVILANILLLFSLNITDSKRWQFCKEQKSEFDSQHWQVRWLLGKLVFQLACLVIVFVLEKNVSENKKMNFCQGHASW